MIYLQKTKEEFNDITLVAKRTYFCTKERTNMFSDHKALNFLIWNLAGIFIFLFIYLLVKLFPIYGTVFSFLWHLFLPFLIACLIAYLLYPVIKKIHHYNIPTSIAILLIYLLFFGGTAYFIYRVYPAVIHELRDLNEQLPQLIRMYEDA